MSTANNRRAYSDAERAESLAALSANGGNVSLTAGQLGIPRTTLVHWAGADASKLPAEVVELRRTKHEELAARFEKLAELAIDIAEQKVRDLDGKAAVITAAVATDKALLLRGEATQITESRGTSESEVRVRLLAERYGQLNPPRVVTPTPATLSGGGEEDTEVE